MSLALAKRLNLCVAWILHRVDEPSTLRLKSSQKACRDAGNQEKIMSTISIEFNGQPKEVPMGTSLKDLLIQAGIKTQFCAVERNLDIVPKNEYETVAVENGDRIEVVTLVGGG